uniref:Uncharacterized protein n=1 Tax=Arundo donax TaxID=35708 RepID=A0A0A9EVJ7_ARUDO
MMLTCWKIRNYSRRVQVAQEQRWICRIKNQDKGKLLYMSALILQLLCLCQDHMRLRRQGEISQ